MAPPPAKRQKRLALDSDEETPSIDEASRIKRQTRASRNATIDDTTKLSPSSTRTTSLRSTPNSSPEKRKGKADTVKSKSLHSFFTKATEEQRWQRKTTPILDNTADEDLEDIDDSDDDILNGKSRVNKTQQPLDKRKPYANGAGSSIGAAGASKTLARPQPSGLPAQKFSTSFKSATSGSTSTSSSQVGVDTRPWADRFAPENLDELAVHKKKVLDVKAWLLDSLGHLQRRQLLVLKGPAGSGKTTTLTLLAKSISVQLLEWKNSTTSDGGSTTSFVSHFDDFLNRGGRFDSLELTNNSNKSTVSGNDENAGRRLLVVDEFPTTFTRSASAVHSFRSSILQYLASGSTTHGGEFFRSNKADANNSPPLVMIISETLLSSATASADSFTAHRLLGPEISNHPGVHVIEFNPVAPTFVSKALDVVIKKEARVSRRRRIPGPMIMKRLSEMGDVRSAVNSLEFLCLRGDENGDWGGRVASKIKKGDKDGITLTAMEKESLELVTQRESTLGMFHAVGKVVYNKRDDPNVSNELVVSPPEHLSYLHRPKPSQVNVDDLMNETGTDISTFISSLHENYVLSCTGPSFVEHLNDCIDYLSDADLLDTSSRRSLNSYRSGIGSARQIFQVGGNDLIRQNEINFDVAVRGLLFALPSPVSRTTHPSGKRGDSHKMFFPSALRLWKKTEEIEGMLSIWRGRLERGSFGMLSTTNNDGPRPKNEGVASWKRSTDLTPISDDTPSQARFLSSRSELLLEYLPYLNKIQQAKHKTTSNNTQPNLSTITQFDGIEPPLEDDDVDDSEINLDLIDDSGNTNNTTTGTPTKKSMARARILPQNDKKTVQVLTQQLEEDSQARQGIEKLYISEDDIEDDD